MPISLLLLWVSFCSLNSAEVAAGAGHAITVHPETNQIQAQLRGKCFSFDKVIPEDADHADVYEIVRPLVHKFVDGYNATILAYGQVRCSARGVVASVSSVRWLGTMAR